MSRDIVTVEFAVFTETRAEVGGDDPHSYAYVPNCYETDERGEIELDWWVRDYLEAGGPLCALEKPPEGEKVEGYEVDLVLEDRDLLEVRDPDGVTKWEAEE